METEQLARLSMEIEALVAAGKEDEAKNLLIKRMADLPEALRAELMLEMYVDSAEREVAGLALKRHIQEKGLAALEVLEAAKENRDRT